MKSLERILILVGASLLLFGVVMIFLPFDFLASFYGAAALILGPIIVLFGILFGSFAKKDTQRHSKPMGKVTRIALYSVCIFILIYFTLMFIAFS